MKMPAVTRSEVKVWLTLAHVYGRSQEQDDLEDDDDEDDDDDDGEGGDDDDEDDDGGDDDDDDEVSSCALPPRNFFCVVLTFWLVSHDYFQLLEKTFRFTCERAGAMASWDVCFLCGGCVEWSTV
jgi:hypothetical protein